MLIRLVLLALTSNLVVSFRIVSTPLDSPPPPEDEEPALMVEPPPAVSLSDIAPIVKPADEEIEPNVEPLKKDTDPNSYLDDDSIKSKHLSPVTPIPHTGNIDNANLLEYSAPINGNNNRKLIVKHAGKDDNCIDYNDYVLLPIDVFKQQL